MFKKSFNKKKIAATFLAVILIAMAGLSLLPVKYSLTIEVANPSRNDVLQVFYDIGNGFNEADSKSITMPVVAMNVQDSATSLITIPLPAKNIQGLRIDPGTGPRAWNLKSIILESKLAGFVLRSHTWLPEDIVRDFTPLHAIDTFSVQNKKLFLNASGDDPYFGYKEDFRKVHKPLWKMARHFKMTLWIITAVLGFLVLLYGRTTLSILKNLFLAMKRLLVATIEILMKPSLFTRQRVMVVSFICALFFIGLVAYNNFRATSRLRFVVDLETSVAGVSQVFYDVGSGYNENDSCASTVQGGNSQNRTFSPLPKKKAIRSIRFDPINVSAVVRIKDARIENKQGDIIKKFPLRDFRPIQQIDKMDIRDGVLIIRTVENANDPIILIENSLIENKFSWNDFIIKRGWIIIGYGLLSLLFLIGVNYFVIFVKRNQYIISGVRSLKIYITENPKKSIAFIGLIAAIASCYPVVFFGMSFVSPTINPTFQLYDYPPFLPGFSLQSIVENARGSDVGSTAWSIVPNTVVQYNALMQYFEFPFWSRYVGGGVPLFAQGQSMIGDILHWIPISLGGSAVGWDIKFVLSKAIFAAGMGLLVFRLTRHFLASSLIAISSCFLGFFAFRFNHPAFFVLTYAPWIVFQWDRLGELLALPRPRIRSCVIQGFLLAAVTWLQLNAGAPKEGVITACFMHALGMMAFMDHVRHRRSWIQSILIALGFGLAVIMIVSPYWLLFLDALSKSFTNYDIPSVNTFPLWRIVGFFDNYFFQQIDGTLGAPSTNIFILLCLTSAIVSLRWHKSVRLFGTMLLFFLALSVAYGVVPKSILISIPFINKIQHVWNVFSVPMMILALILAGYGIQHYFDASEKHKKMILALSLSTFLGLWLVYILMTRSGRTILFFLVVFAVIVVGIRQLYRQAESGVWSKRMLIILACCFLLLHVRHGMHLMTGIGGINDYIQNPTKRANFSNKSAAIEFVKNRIKEKMMPLRVIGEGFVMFPGYNSMVGLEGIVSVEALRNGHFEKLLGMVDYPDMGWSWLRLIKSDQIDSRAASLDLLGVGFIVATVGIKMPQDMKLVQSSDLDVWQRESAWPRAFFVNKIIEVHKPSDILDALADKSHTPFAAVESQFIPQGVLNNNAPYRVVPAGEYSLTNNSTNFSVEASGPGIIVLGETYYPEDFVASLNSKRVDYIRVNQAFKGIWIKEAGRYDVSFTYRPEKLNQAILICLFGLVLLLLLIRMSVGIPERFKMNNS